MKVTWFGHSSFLIENSDNEKILMDPYDEVLGGCPYRGSVNIVTISHNHFDHNFLDYINPGAVIINSVCSYENKTIKIQGYPSFHDRFMGKKRGDNIIYVIETEGYRLCHLGDLGHMLSQEQIDLLGEIDILFIPVEGNFTLDEETAAKLCKKLNSRVIVPMHYKCDNINYPCHGIEKFIALMKNAMNINSNYFIFDDFLNKNNQVLILKP